MTDVELSSEAERAAAALRERASTWRPDEDLASSIERNDVAAEAFARAYARLRHDGRRDRALDDFAVQDASPDELRRAADLLEQLARSGPSTRPGSGRLSPELVRKYGVAAVLVAVVLALVPAVFGMIFLSRAVEYRGLAVEGRVAPLLFFSFAAALCFAGVAYVASSIVRFFRGEQSRLFRTRRRHRPGRDPFEFKRDPRTGAEQDYGE